MNELIESKLKALPEKPGVYIMKDSLNHIIYVGKAKILKNRVRQYFHKSGTHTSKVLRMVENISDFSWIVTDSEIEALILECNLIKRHRPKYNVLLKDDKTFPYIKITVSEDYPRILLTRNTDDKKDKYFGPFVSSYSVKNTIDLLRKTYGIRDCNRDMSKISKQRECLNYHINQCSSPCMNYISKEEYRERIHEIIAFLEGKSLGILKKLDQEMKEASQNLQFERAAELRDRINHLNHILEKQKISVPKDSEFDIIGLYQGERHICITVMFVRGGKLLGAKNMYFNAQESQEDVLSGFLKQFYDKKDLLPPEILLPIPLEDQNLLEGFLSQVRGSNVALNVPVRGRKKELVELANQNALEGINQRATNRFSNALEELKNLLHLPQVPERIEVYDISNTGGADMVGYMTVFLNGVPAKSEYRKFKIKYTEAQDDYECMYEVIYRRLLRYLEESKQLREGQVEPSSLKFIHLPDLIFVDGGKNHVKAGKRAVSMAELSIDVFGLVKDNKHKTRDITSEFREYESFKNRPVFHLVSGMQEETHNQAIAYHHLVRSKTTVESELLSIPGVGDKIRTKLFKAFGTIDQIKEATVLELSAVVNQKTAEEIYRFYHR